MQKIIQAAFPSVDAAEYAASAQRYDRARGYLMAGFQFVSPDIAVDIGTDNTRVYVKDKGIVVNEPSVVITRGDNTHNNIVAVGDSAEEMIGRSGGNIRVIHPLRDGVIVDYETESHFPRYGNDDDRADEIAVWLLKTFLDKIKKHHTYRNSEPTTSILTITSNVVYGKATGTMPDGRKAGAPLSPGANPSYGAEQSGLLASLNSVAKLPYEWALDGISNTQTINPGALGHSEEEKINNLVQVMDGYFDQGAHHLNVNVFGTEKLIDAMEHPEKEEYQNFTIRVSGYAVKFIDLTKEQQMDVISRTCHDRM